MANEEDEDVAHHDGCEAVFPGAASLVAVVVLIVLLHHGVAVGVVRGRSQGHRSGGDSLGLRTNAHPLHRDLR